jgi:hypothetical protein
MGRKSSAKAQAAPTAQPPNEPPRRRGALPVIAALALLVVVGVITYSRSGTTDATSASSAAAQTQTTPAGPPATAKFGPHKQEHLPPLPFDPEPPARPPDVVNAAYKFAAEHPEVLSYVPCYCGCERSGHRGNDDCFVTARAPNGDVTEWEPHGMT